MKTQTKKGSKLSSKQKKIIDIVVLALQIAIVIVSITISAIVLANPNINSGEVGKSNVKLMPVLTNSMTGDNKDSFSKGDLLIMKTPKDTKALKVGDIVTFKGQVMDTDQLITHRIVDVSDDGLRYTCRGDADVLGTQIDTIAHTEVLAVYSGHLNGVGSAIFWLQKPTNFLLVIVVPLALLFIYNIIMFVRMMMQAKLEKMKEQSDSTATLDEEAIKRQAIEEYQAQLAKENAELAKETTSKVESEEVVEKVEDEKLD